MSESSVVGILCLKCSALLVSWWQHDYKVCGCANRAMIDGGREYLRYGAAKWDDVQLVRLAFFSRGEQDGKTWEEISARIAAADTSVGASAGQRKKNRRVPKAGQ